MIATMKGCKGKIKQETKNEGDFFKFTTKNRKRKVRERSSEEYCGGFVKKELDAVETLMEFFRQVQSPAKDTALEHTRDFNFTWAVKKSRSISFRKVDNHPILGPVGGVGNSADVSAISLFSSSKFEAAGDIGLPGFTKPEVKIASFDSSKDFSFVDSRAESPNSPLPVLKEDCFSNYCVIMPNAEEDFMPSTFQQRPSMLAAEISMPPFLISCKVEKDEEIGMAKHVKVLPSNAVKASKTISWIKRENALEHSDLSIMCKHYFEKDALELDASCENKSTCLHETLKADAKPELSFDSTSSDFFSNQVSGGRHFGKQKLVLSESEQEARRLRRVQANRESARQAILRKQILCEELTKRANELLLMNEIMKQERAVLKQDCQSLYDANSFLKKQCATIDIVQGTGEVLSQPSADAGPPSPTAMHVPFVPLLGLPYQSYPWALSRTKAGGMKCDPLQAEGEKAHSFEKSASASYASSVAFGILFAMGENGHMQMPVSSVSQSSIVIHTPDQSQSGSPFSSVPVNMVDLSLAGDRVENAAASCSSQWIGDVELTHVDATSQEQNLAPGHAPQFLNSVSSVTDTEAANVSVQFTAFQSASNWQLTGSPLWDPFRATKPFGRQNLVTLKVELEKLYSSIKRKEGDLLQGHQRQLLHICAIKDAAAITKAAEARRRRKEITRNKSLLRQRSSKI